METNMLSINVWYRGVLYKNVGCLPIENGHVWAQIGNDIIECKKCSRCGEWLAIEDFSANRASKDGLCSWCKPCTSAYQKGLRSKKSTPPVDNEETDIVGESETPIEMDLEYVWADFREKLTELFLSKSDISESQINRLNDKIEELERENQALREKNEKLSKEILAPITVDDLNNTLVEEYLKNHVIAPRVLYNAIKPQSPNIEITICDKITGMTRVYREEQAESNAA